MAGLTGYLLYLFYSIFSVLCLIVTAERLDICDRNPIHTTAERTTGDGGFGIKILGLPSKGKYRPGDIYTIQVKKVRSKQLDESSEVDVPSVLLGLMLVAYKQPKEGQPTDESAALGEFIISPSDQVKLALECDHPVITHHYPLPKHDGVSFKWQAPKEDSGCVVFRTTIIAQSTLWYKDDGNLTLKLCEFTSIDGAQGDVPLPDVQECCACGHARYKMTFTGLWSKQTHPKDFPSGPDALRLHWSTILGSSHTEDYSIWRYAEHASPGVREMCQYGYSTSLERDMRENSRKIRTVIKTSPMWQNIQGIREATFTVNQKAHFLSLLTMIGPSPDWCVGVSDLNVCQANCTWADSLEVDLYPWDAGTDSALRYVNIRRLPTDPPERIHRLTNTYPNHPDSPFYGSAEVRPMARLTLEKTKDVCDTEDDTRTSSVGSPSTQELVEQMKKSMMKNKKLQMMKCATTKWTSWTECSADCGFGLRHRTRSFRTSGVTSTMCSSVDLAEQQQCEGNCTGGRSIKHSSSSSNEHLLTAFEDRQPVNIDLDDPCSVTPWSEWSPCSAKVCGMGQRERWRMFLRKSAQLLNCGKKIMEKASCYAPIRDCRKTYMMKNFTDICSLSADAGPCRGNFQRWYYSRPLGKCLPFRFGGCRGNMNKFETEEDCQRQCAAFMARIDSRLNEINGELVELSNEQLKRLMMSNPGEGNQLQLDSTNVDDIELIKKKKRKQLKKQRRLEKLKRRKNRRRQKERKREKDKSQNTLTLIPADPPVDCVVTDWTEWSECSVTCGKGHITRVRSIKLEAKNGGKRCPKKLERRKKCKLDSCPVDCEMSEWSSWSECSATCGTKAVQERHREVVQRSKRGGGACPSKNERQFCNLQACTDDEEMEKFLHEMQAFRPH